MTTQTRRRMPACFARAGAIAIACAALAVAPAAAQKTGPAGETMENEFQRIAEERAARIRDLLTVISIGARKDVAISFGQVEASADGETIRVHNVVVVDRSAPAVQVSRMVEIKDFDRRHFFPRHLRLRGDGHVLMATMPTPIRAVFKQLGLPQIRSFTTIEYVYDEAKGVLTLKALDVEWRGQFKLSISATLENFPKLNTLLEASQREAWIKRRMQQVRFSALRIEIRSRTVHEIAYSAAGMFGGMTKAQARQQALAMLDQRTRAARNKLEQELARGLRVLATGPGILTATLTASPALPFSQLQLRTPDQLMKAVDIKVTARNMPAAEVLPGKLPEAWSKLPVSDATDPGVHECDRYAAAPGDGAKKTDGVPDRAVDEPMALAACRRATLEYPKAARFQFQYGRALLLAKVPATARVWLKRAADSGHDAAKALLVKAK